MTVPWALHLVEDKASHLQTLLSVAWDDRESEGPGAWGPPSTARLERNSHKP